MKGFGKENFKGFTQENMNRFIRDTMKNGETLKRFMKEN